MPPQRIFPELTGIAQYQREKTMAIKQDMMLKVNEQEVVETVKKYREGVLDEEPIAPSGSSVLKKDNVLTSEVVKIIENHRSEKKLKSYQKFSLPTTTLKPLTMVEKVNLCMSPKIEELKSIFEDNDEDMEWDKITMEVMKQMTSDYSVENPKYNQYLKKASGVNEEAADDWLKFRVQQSVIKRLEGHDLIKRYMNLNQDFEHRVKEENREKDVKNVNEKRAQKSLKEQNIHKKRGVDNNKN